MIRGGEIGLELRDSARIRFVGNFLESVRTAIVKQGECTDVEVLFAESRPELELGKWPNQRGARRGREFILMREWGPYDFSAPILHPDRIEGHWGATFMVLGETGRIELLEASEGVEVRLVADSEGRGSIQVRPRGPGPSLRPFRFKVRADEKELIGTGSLLDARWSVRFWNWETDPREDGEAFSRLLASEPAAELARVTALDFHWGPRGPGGLLADDGFAMLAETTLTLAAGEYEFVTISDDGVRVLVDGKKVIENWTHHTPTEDQGRIRLEEGTHEVRVEYFEIDGLARLSFRLRRVGD